MHHPNVVRIFDLGVADDHAYIAMEYLGAGASRSVSTRRSTELALRYARDVGSALTAMHGGHTAP